MPFITVPRSWVKIAGDARRAILALLSEPTVGLAAQRSGVAARTLRRWLSEDEGFKADLAAARRATFEAGVGRIQALSEKAVGALEDLLDVRRHPAVRLGAARTILELGLSRYDAENILKKLAVIEQRQEGQDRRWRRS